MTKSLKQITIPIILGPTSTGKTSLAVRHCQLFGGEIISADSRQVVKHMDIGTGKAPVSQENRAENNQISVEKGDKKWMGNGVNIWGYDLTDPNTYFSAYDYAKWALLQARKLLEQGKTVFLVGGTGFYIDIFTKRKSLANVKPDLELRESLGAMTTKDLFAQLTSLGPKKAASVDGKNKARLIRAIEIELAAKKKGAKSNPPLPYLENVEFKFIGLTAPREILYQRTDNWLDKVWENGLLKETTWLIQNGYQDSPKLKGLVYKTVVDYLQGNLNSKEAKQRIKYDLHAYIRRQQTYFKKNPHTTWLDITKPNFEQKAKHHLKQIIEKTT